MEFSLPSAYFNFADIVPSFFARLVDFVHLTPKKLTSAPEMGQFRNQHDIFVIQVR